MSYQYKRNQIKCICGTSFSPGLEEQLEEELMEGTESYETANEEATCPSCHSVYLLDVCVQKTVQIVSHSLTLLTHVITDTEGNQFPLSTMESLQLFDSLPLADGIYTYGEREYQVKNKKIINYWMRPDENQLSFFEEMAS